MAIDKVHYRIPLKLFTSHNWANLTPPARAVLPVIGVYADETGRSFPSQKLIAEQSGYYEIKRMRIGIYCLIEAGLLKKQKVGRHNEYYLKGNAIWLGGSYFPFLKEIIKKGYWANLSPSEKAVFPLLAVKASISNPELENYENPHAHGIVRVFPKKMLPLAGVSKRAFYYAIQGLVFERWIGSAFLDYENEYVVYKKPC